MSEITKRELFKMALRWLHLSQGRPDDCRAYWENPSPEAARAICLEYLGSPEGESTLAWLGADVKKSLGIS